MKIKGGVASHGEAVVDAQGRLLVDIAGGGGGVGGIDYSTSEQDTGLKWIGGETVYQKTIDFGGLPDTGSKDVAHGIVGLDVVIDFWGVCKETGFPSWILTNRAHHTDNFAIELGIIGPNINVLTSIDQTVWTITWVTIIYTKT